jgi:hypothetical protein
MEEPRGEGDSGTPWLERFRKQPTTGGPNNSPATLAKTIHRIEHGGKRHVRRSLCQRNWKELIDAAIFETDLTHLSERVQDATMNELEDFLSGRECERT